MIWRRLSYVPVRLRNVWREAITDADLHYDIYVAWREHLGRLGLQDLRGLDVLDIGGGDRAPLSLLFASDGARVTSLDMLPVAFGWRRPSMWWGVAKANGPARAFRAVARDAVHTVRYWRHLKRRTGRQSLAFGQIRLVRGDAAQLPFPDASFDVVVSSAVWEHLSDVQRASDEVSRVLRPSGVAVILIALFPALQGGHHAEWHSVEPTSMRSIRPWDHLYPDRKPLPTYLNEWRESQYREAMERSLDVVEWEDGELRGADLLTDAVRADLSQFSQRDLVLSWLTAWARRRR
jgi:SAM-dependent methyltransferase